MHPDEEFRALSRLSCTYRAGRGGEAIGIDPRQRPKVVKRDVAALPRLWPEAATATSRPRRLYKGPPDTPPRLVIWHTIGPRLPAWLSGPRAIPGSIHLPHSGDFGSCHVVRNSTAGIGDPSVATNVRGDVGRIWSPRPALRAFYHAEAVNHIA